MYYELKYSVEGKLGRAGSISDIATMPNPVPPLAGRSEVGMAERQWPAVRAGNVPFLRFRRSASKKPRGLYDHHSSQQRCMRWTECGFRTVRSTSDLAGVEPVAGSPMRRAAA